jgi:hypothetical protein
MNEMDEIETTSRRTLGNVMEKKKEGPKIKKWQDRGKENSENEASLGDRTCAHTPSMQLSRPENERVFAFWPSRCANAASMSSSTRMDRLSHLQGWKAG